MTSQKDILTRNGILDFANYAESFSESTLILGNGFSINLCSRLDYTSLYKIFLDIIQDQRIEDLFNNLKTTNFEIVLNSLQIASRINGIFGIDTTHLDNVIGKIKTGLIQAISSTHPRASEIDIERLKSIALNLLNFGTIYTTNYDIFIYKISLLYNDMVNTGEIPGNIYKDYFADGIGNNRIAFKDVIEQKKMINYLHGSLFMFYERTTYKYVRADNSKEIIDILNNHIEEGNIPLFIAEGSAADKINAIDGNYYLRSRLAKLRRNRDKIVVCGLSFGASDKHIVDAINESPCTEILISIYVGSKTEDELRQKTSEYRHMFVKKKVQFYDSKSLF